MWWMVNAMPHPRYAWKWSGTLCIGGWMDKGPVWMGAKNLTHTGIRYLDRLARSELLYRLRNNQNTL
jgi:hypothetical protein